MSEERVDSPQLSEDGARLLADVLARRKDEARHDTSSARGNTHRRGSDALRSDPSPEFVEQLQPELDVARPKRPEPERRGAKKVIQYSEAPEPEVDKRSYRLIGAVVFVAALVASAVLFVVLEPLPADNDTDEVAAASAEEVDTEVLDTAVTADTVELDTEESSEVEPEAELIGETPVEEVGADVSTSRVASEVSEGDARVAAGDVDVFVYDTASEGEVYSFALRLRSVSTNEELPTDDFVVVVENEEGFAAQTFTRFVHSTLPVDSSALATVRAEDTAPGDQFVSVWLDNVMMARLPIEPVEP